MRDTGKHIDLLPFDCPDAPNWQVNWDALDAEYTWIRAMGGCPQDPVFHAEGDVSTHVRMVCEAMASLDEWRLLPEDNRQILYAAALLHDQAKPSCTREEAGRITSRGHSVRGAIDARKILWELNSDFTAREQACALVRYHQSPFHLVERPDSQRQAMLISQTAPCNLLSILAKSDILGRHCADKQQLLDQVALFEEYCREQECLTHPRAFASAHSRFEYFRTDDRDPDYRVHEDFRCEVTLMSGLPGAGKDTWLQRHAPELPVISLDTIRKDIGAPPTGKQGAVFALAKERAREWLRQHRDFAWNATNLSREIRGRLIDLFASYNARIRIVYVEAVASTLELQNRNRESTVPSAAAAAMMDRWELPSPIEADEVQWWVDGKLIP